MRSERYLAGCLSPYLVTMSGEGDRLSGFNLTGLLNSIGTTAAQVTGLVSTIKERPAPVQQQLPAAGGDWQKYMLPAGIAAGALVLFMLLKGK